MTCILTTIMSFEQNLKITCKLPINMAFDRKVWTGVWGRCNDADRGGQLEHHQDLPGVKGGKFFISVAPILITSTPVSSPSPIFTSCQRLPPYPSSILTLWEDMAQKCPSPWIVKEIEVLIIYEWIFFGTSDFRHNLVMINQVTRWSLPTPFTWWTLCYTLLHFVTWSFAPWWDHCYTVIGELTVTHGGTPVVTWRFVSPLLHVHGLRLDSTLKYDLIARKIMKMSLLSLRANLCLKVYIWAFLVSTGFLSCYHKRTYHPWIELRQFWDQVAEAMLSPGFTSLYPVKVIFFSSATLKF